MNIPSQRLSNQYLARKKFKDPADVVNWLGAVQAQDYLGSLWAIGQRTIDATERDVENAVADRRIIRTWPMRGTLHFVPAVDVRWMLKLLTPRVISRSAGRYRQLELDEHTFARSAKVFERVLRGGKQLTRKEMYTALEASNIRIAGQRGIHIIGHLAQDGLICFAARRGKQQTFALLDEWVPASRNLDPEEGLAKLTKCYFRSHGPATLHDFTWWSGLKTSEARAGLGMVQTELACEVHDGQAYWFPSLTSRSANGTSEALLLPTYDEYTVAYKDRSTVLNPRYARQAGNGIFSSTIAMNGQIVGTWGRRVQKDAVIINTNLFKRFTRPETGALQKAATRYGDFVGAPVVLQ
ncbi:MAG TPA: winged helix DNA-binding domain-containing protein [Pyrinomonadaceae bacterium]